MIEEGGGATAGGVTERYGPHGRGRARALLTPLVPRPLPGAISGHYSRFVTCTKILLPSVAVVLIALLVLWPQIERTGDRFRLGFTRDTPGGANAVRMLKVRYTGIDEDNRPYTITADSASQIGDKAARVTLRQPQADITMTDGTWLALTAATGYYTQQRRELDLEGMVSLFHDKGYEMQTERVHVDLAAGTATGNERVAGHGPFGELWADGFRITDEGRTVQFTGKARLVLFPRDDGASP